MGTKDQISMASRIATFLAVVSTIGGLLFHSASAACNSGPQYIITPSYVFPCDITVPTCAWYRFSNGADYVIINPNSGPGTAVDAQYTQLVNQIRATPSNATYITTIMGYVSTNYSNVPIEKVRSDIDKYMDFYKVDGIFFDEASTNCSVREYYRLAVDYVITRTKSPTKQDYTVLNWGTNGPRCFLQTTPAADVFVTFENPYGRYTSYTPDSYMASYPEERFYHIVYNVSAANLPAAIKKSKQARAGRIYFTPDTNPNPYDTAPPASYWNTEVNGAANACY